jgi:hypothetical protein
MVAPKGRGTELVDKMSLSHAAGVYESRGRLGGLFIGGSDSLFFGRYTGKSQSRLSKMVDPPRKMPYVVLAILWLLGFFILMAFDGRGKLSWLMRIISATYILIIPVYFLAALFYNWFVRPKKHKDWERKFMCQRCGALIEALTVKPRRFTSGPFRGPRVKQKCGRVSRGIMVRWRARANGDKAPPRTTRR